MRNSAARRGGSRWSRRWAGLAVGLRRVAGALGALLLVAVFALALAVAIVPAAAGGSAVTIESPSMAPTYPVGTLVVIRPRPIEQVRIGDVVTFTDTDPVGGARRSVTHRVVGIVGGIEAGPSLRTKGDANAAPDPRPVTGAALGGVAWYALPKIGGWGTALRTVPGLLLAFGGVLILAAALLAVSRKRP